MSLIRDRFKRFQTREVAVWALSIGTSICTLLLARTIYNFHQRRRHGTITTSDKKDRNHNNNNEDGVKGDRTSTSKDDVQNEDRKLFLTVRSARSQLVPAPLWRQFEEAAYRIRNDDGTTTTTASRPKQFVTKHLTNGDKLLLYALYKQIVDGNAPPKMIHSRTNWNIMAEKAKYDAWTRMRDIPIHAAIDHYVTAVAHFCAPIPTTQPPSVSGKDTDDVVDEDEDEEDTITSYSETGDIVETIFAPAAVSRPGIEHGGWDYNDDIINGTDVLENGDGTNYSSNISLEVQLLHAVGRNSFESVQRILKEHNDDTTFHAVNVNYSDETGQTALHLAADKGNDEMVQLLIQAGGNVNATDHDGISVLQAAVIAGHVSTCQLLLSHRANPDQPDHDGDTPRSCCDDDLDNIDMVELFSKY